MITMRTPLETVADLEAAYANGLLRKQVLEHGAYYHGLSRNAGVARWHAGQARFVYMRVKFGATFAEGIRHPADERMFDVFRPLERIEPSDYERIDDAVFEQILARGRP